MRGWEGGKMRSNRGRRQIFEVGMLNAEVGKGQSAWSMEHRVKAKRVEHGAWRKGRRQRTEFGSRKSKINRSAVNQWDRFNLEP